MRIQISPIDYLKYKFDQLQRLVESSNKDGDHINVNANIDNQIKTSTSGSSYLDENLALPKLFQEEELVVLATSYN